jgi:cell division protein FtsB
MNRRIDEVISECEDRIKLFKAQIDSLTANSTELTHQLKLLENQYKDMLMKSNLMTQ